MRSMASDDLIGLNEHPGKKNNATAALLPYTMSSPFRQHK
jgi:hypothetical protein